jgi:signal transduction histidine kinase
MARSHAMKHLPRILFYVGLTAGLIVLARCCSVEHARVLDQPGASKARMISFLAGSLVFAIGLGLLCARDLRQLLANRTVRAALMPADTPPPPMEEAAIIRETDPLEAVRVLREYLDQYPGDAQAMQGIAEIYEQDLRNPVAAVLEYEELLQYKLDPERWGSLAIHLTNLYIRLKQPEKAVALLHRIDQKCGDTAAALKARKRLEQVDG